MTPQQAQMCNPGDRVRWITSTRRGSVLEVNEDGIRVEWDDGETKTYLFREIHGGFFHLVRLAL